MSNDTVQPTDEPLVQKTLNFEQLLYVVGVIESIAKLLSLNFKDMRAAEVSFTDMWCFKNDIPSAWEVWMVHNVSQMYSGTEPFRALSVCAIYKQFLDTHEVGCIFLCVHGHTGSRNRGG